MEISELKTMWKAHEQKLDKSLRLNLHCLEMIQAQKVKSKLAPLLWLRVAEVFFHLIIIWWLGGFIYNHLGQWVYALAALGLFAFYIIAFVNCLKQIIIISELDYSANVISMQSSLEKLQSHGVNYLRLTFLVIPTYLAYPIVRFKALGFDIVANLHGNWWKGQILFCLFYIHDLILNNTCVCFYRNYQQVRMYGKLHLSLIGFHKCKNIK